MYKAYYTLQAEKYGFNAGAANYGNKPWDYNLSVHGPVIDAIKASGGKLVRIDFNIKDSMNLTMPGEYEPSQKEYHRLLFDYLAKKDMIPVIVLNSDIPTQYVYRKILSDATGDQTYLTDVNKFIKDTYRRKAGTPKVFWSIINKQISNILQLGATVYAANGKQWTGYSITDVDNETAYVIDTEFAADPSIPYGTYPPNYAEMMEHRLYGEDGANFWGSVYLPGAYENQAGIDTEVLTGGGKWRNQALWENVHLYINWLTNDTKEFFAVRIGNALTAFINKIDSLADSRSGKPIAITEFNGIGIPQNIRNDVMVYTAKQLLRNPRVICAIGYSMIENTWNGTNFPASKWTVMDYPTLRWGPSGYVPYEYNTYPASWNWSGYLWNSPSNWATSKKQKECVHVVEKNIIIQFKKWIYQNELYWGEGEITGPNLGYGVYTFTTDTSVNNLGENIVLSLSISNSDPINPRDVQIAKIGSFGNGTGSIESTNPAVIKVFNGKLPSGKITFKLEYRSTFIKWDWYDELNNNIFTHTHTGQIPDNFGTVKATLYSKRDSAVLVNKPIYVALKDFKFQP